MLEVPSTAADGAGQQVPPTIQATTGSHAMKVLFTMPLFRHRELFTTLHVREVTATNVEITSLVQSQFGRNRHARSLLLTPHFTSSWQLACSSVNVEVPLRRKRYKFPGPNTTDSPQLALPPGAFGNSCLSSSRLGRTHARTHARTRVGRPWRPTPPSQLCLCCWPRHHARA